MPRSGDAYLEAALPVSHNPLERIGFQTKKPTVADTDESSESWATGVNELFKRFFKFDLKRPSTIPITSIAFTTPNLQPDEHFLTANWLTPYPYWNLDKSVRKGLLGNSLHTTGAADQMITLRHVDVRDTQNLRTGIEVKWAGAMGAGAICELAVQPFDSDGNPLALSVVDSVTVTGDGDWVQLSDDTYITPTGSDEAALCLRVRNATAGDFWFDEPDVRKPLGSGVAPLEWIDGLPDALNGVSDFIQQIIDRIHQGNNNTDAATGRSILDMFGGISFQRRQQDDLASGLAALVADQSSTASAGSLVQVSVSDYGAIPSVFTKFYDTGSGNVEYYADGDGVVRFTNNTGLELYGYTGPDLLTDYPEVSLLLTRQTQDYVGSYGNRAVWFVSRLNAARTEGLVCRVRGRTARFGYVTGGGWGSPTWLASEQNVDVASYMTFRAGTTAAEPRQLQLLSNNLVKATQTDTAAASLLDSSHRGWGWGLEHDTNDFINRSAYVARMLANDNYPIAVPGSGATMNRLLTGSVGVSSGVNVFPSGFFNNTAESTSDILVDPTNAAFTITDADWYTFVLRVKAGFLAGSHLEFLLYLNGVPYRYGGGDQMFGSNAAGGTIPPQSYYASWKIPVPAAGVVTAAYDASGSTGAVLSGDASGMKTYFSCSKG